MSGECGTFIDIDALKAKSDDQTTCTEYMETDNHHCYLKTNTIIFLC